MKAQMRFQKYLCLAMIIVGALALLYAFVYCSGSVYGLKQCITRSGIIEESIFHVAQGTGKNDAMLYREIQGFNNAMMYCGIVMIVLAVLLYITSCQKRRKYYISNYVATGVCAGGNIVMSLVLMIFNGNWRAEFLNVDFAAWLQYNQIELDGNPDFVWNYSESTAWFDLGFAVYALVIVASVLLILNLVWKIMLMKGEKALLSGNQLVGGEVA